MNENLDFHNQASPTPLLPDANRYALTISEASAILKLAGCKFSSMRKVQRLCRNGNIDCHKLTTTRNGQPLTEWLVNETSLRTRIELIEPRMEDGDVNSPSNQFGNAINHQNEETPPNALAPSKPAGDAKSVLNDELYQSGKPDDMTTPNRDGDARHVERSKAEFMIENAKLSAELVGVKSMITQILSDKSFLHEELRDAREGRKDVTKIAERMLEAMETMAVGAKLHRLPTKDAQDNPAHGFESPSGDSNRDHMNQFGV